MAKAEIISHIGDGQYSVKLLRDRTWLDGRIAWADARIAELQDERQPIADALDALLSERDELQQELYDLIDQHSIENDLTGDIRQVTVLLIRKREEASQMQAQLSRVDADMLSVEKGKQQLEAQAAAIEADTRAVWCADLTTTLTGEHPTLEVNGTSDHAILMPGKMAGEYTGDLAPVMAMTVAQACYNFAIHPGWQRHTPTFRTGAITALAAAQDTCSVELAPAADRYQGLEINEAETLDNVPINYMTCNAAAFAVGDDVVIKMQGQSWASPLVIGFKEEPKPCDAQMIVIVSSQSGAEAVSWDLINNEIVAAGSLSDVAIGGAVEALPSGYHDVAFGKFAYSPPNYNKPYDIPTTAFYDPGDPWGGSVSATLFPHSDNNYKYEYIVNPHDPEQWAGMLCLVQGGTQAVANLYPTIEMTSESCPNSAEVSGEEDYEWTGRQMFFFHSAFGYDMTDVQASPHNLDLLCHIKFDAWSDGEYFCYDGTLFPELEYGSQHFNILGIFEGLESPSNITGPVSNVASGHPYFGLAVIGGSGVVAEGVSVLGNSMDYYGEEHLENHQRALFLYAHDGDGLNGFARELFDSVNSERVGAGLSALKYNFVLQEAAQRHSGDMAEHEFESHTGSDGSTLGTRVFDDTSFMFGSKNIQGIIGENIAVVTGLTAAEVVQGWKDSPEHWANITDEDYTDASMAVVLGSDGRHYITQVFGFRANMWPGFAAIDTVALVAYIDSNFSWIAEEDKYRDLRFFLT